jgi:hypothetical protein
VNHGDEVSDRSLAKDRAGPQIKLPPFRGRSGELRQNTNFLERYLESPHWPVPPPVPKAIATILRPLPDRCPSCGATDFNVVLNSNQDAWEVVCAGCGVNPGVRADAD